MNNYICINNQRIELTAEQAGQIAAALNPQNNSAKLADMAVGEIFRIGDYDLVILEQSGDTTAVICKELFSDTELGESNNYDGSHVDEKCQEFAREVADIIGLENIVEHTVDLTSNDGLKDYGTIKRCASVLTADRYRRYVEILDTIKPDDWWWLATPWSNKKHDIDTYVLCVSPSGYFDSCYYGREYGVRPFCILKSNIFVSK